MQQQRRGKLFLCKLRVNNERYPMSDRTPAFFRYHYDKVIMTLIILIVALLALVGVVMYQVSHRPLPQFAAVSADGNTLALQSFDSPLLLPDTLITWASKAAVAAYTFDFVSYKKQINDARPYFTSDGWSNYQSSVSGLIATITKNQLFVNGVVAGAPVISNQGDLPGRGYAWRIQMPFLVTYQSAEQSTKTHYTIVMTIVRVPTRENPKGIGIDGLVMM